MRNIYFIIAVCWLSLVSSLFAQTPKVDSLKRLLALTGDEKVQCDALLELSFTYISQMNIPLAKRYAEQGLTLAQSKNDKKAIGKGHFVLGSVYSHLSDYRQAEANFHTALYIARELGDNAAKSSVLNGLGLLYQDNNEPDRAIEKYIQAANLEAENSPKRAALYVNIGNVCRRQGEHGDTSIWQKSDIYYTKALRIAQHIGDSARIASVNTSMGRLALLRGKPQTALMQLRNARKIALRAHQNGTVLACLVYAGETFLQLPAADSTIVYLEQAKAITQQNGDIMGTADIAAMLGKAYLLKKNIPKATENAKLCRQLSDSVRKNSGLVMFYQIYYLLDSARGDYAAAFRSLQRYRHERDSTFQSEKSQKIADLESRYRTERTERELAALRQAEKMASLRQWLLLIGIVLLLGIGAWVYRTERIKNRQRETLRAQESALAEAEKRQMQIEKEHINTQLLYKNKELSTLALHIIERSTTFDKVREKMKEIARLDDATMRKSLVAFIRSIDAQENLQEDVNKFNLYLDDTHKDFFYKLKQLFPNLTQGEERLCTLLRLDLSTQEIAALNSSQPRTVQVAIFRLKKKLGYEEREDMVNFLQQL